jgi:UDPglucose 6-dehydrogenase
LTHNGKSSIFRVRKTKFLSNECDAIMLITEWSQYKLLDMKKVAFLMKYPALVDTRNMYDPGEMSRIGFIYEEIGRTLDKETKLKYLVHDLR